MEKTSNKIQWHKLDFDQNELKPFFVRTNYEGSINLALHFSLLIVTGLISFFLSENGFYLLSFIALLLHGFIYSFLGYAGLGHELFHNTVFKNKKINLFFFKLVSRLTWNNHIYFKESHKVHHSHTLHSNIDYEVTLPQESLLKKWYSMIVFDYYLFIRSLKYLLENSFDIVKGGFGEEHFQKGTNQRKDLVLEARKVLLIHFLFIVIFMYFGLWQLIFLVSLAPFFFTIVNRLLSQAQHFGMNSNVNNHLENSRTVILNPFLSFIYWQMNYHAEHHMYPAIPFHKLKSFHNFAKKSMKAPTYGLLNALKILR